MVSNLLSGDESGSRPPCAMARERRTRVDSFAPIRSVPKLGPSRTRPFTEMSARSSPSNEYPENAEARRSLQVAYRLHSRQVLATLIRLLGGFDLAEEAMHDAFVAAAQQWPRDGVP